jgi:MYXO-CTERM domain-containing protein
VVIGSLLIAINMGGPAPVIWMALMAVGAFWRGRRRVRSVELDRQHRFLIEVDQLVQQGNDAEQLRDIALAHATSNLVAAEMALTNTSFDYSTPMDVNELRRQVASFAPSGNAHDDAARARGLAERSRAVLAQTKAARSGNLVRTGAFVVGMFRGTR